MRKNSAWNVPIKEIRNININAHEIKLLIIIKNATSGGNIAKLATLPLHSSRVPVCTDTPVYMFVYRDMFCKFTHLY